MKKILFSAITGILLIGSGYAYQGNFFVSKTQSEEVGINCQGEMDVFNAQGEFVKRHTWEGTTNDCEGAWNAFVKKTMESYPADYSYEDTWISK